MRTHTGNPLKGGTVGQRIGPVFAYYADREEKGLYHGDIGAEAGRVRDSGLPIDLDPMAHIRTGRKITHAASKLIPKTQSTGGNIRPFSTRELRLLLETVGPTATERHTDDHRPVRDRLMVDWCWAVGLRLSEVLSLGLHQFLSIFPDVNAPWDHCDIRVLGKGNKWRPVLVPNWLVSDTLSYMETERNECLEAGHVKRRDAPTELFLSGTSSQRPGRPFTPRRVQAIVATACIDAGLVRHVERTDAETGVRTIVQRPQHCVHDLRHTYAVLTYWAEVRAGNPEPWKRIQSQLGHESMETTKRIYLRHVNGHNEFGSASIRELVGLPRGAR